MNQLVRSSSGGWKPNGLVIFEQAAVFPTHEAPSLAFRTDTKGAVLGLKWHFLSLKTGQKWGSLFTEFTDMLIGKDL